ncbi:MAG: hypothetical protein JXA67_10490 [Micromonosporaceae bacterium]|nr:hypothetical protein [Micromonosporaceae bacterium]
MSDRIHPSATSRSLGVLLAGVTFLGVVGVPALPAAGVPALPAAASTGQASAGPAGTGAVVAAETATCTGGTASVPRTGAALGDPTLPAVITVVGTVALLDLEGGCLVLLADSQRYLLLGGDQERVLVPGNVVEVVGQPRPDLASVCMVGVVLEVLSATVLKTPGSQAAG